MIHFLGILGIVLLLGGAAHSAGVLRLYVTSGVPEANRVIVDVWVAQAQLLGGGVYLAAFRAARSGTTWRGLATFGALTIIGFSVTMLPVLFSRAPWRFRAPVIVYLLCSMWVLAWVAGARHKAPSSALATDAARSTESLTT